MPEVNLDSKCRKCKHSLKLGAANSVLVLFDKSLPMSFLRITCPRPQCEHSWNTFIDDDYDDANRIIKHILEEGWPLDPQLEVPEWVKREWQREMGYKLVTVHELLPRHEELIARLAQLLDETPTEVLMFLFNSPPPKSYLPEEWT